MRQFLAILSILLVSFIAGSVYIYQFYFITNVEKLASHYPVWDPKEEVFYLQKERPPHWVDLRQVSKYGKWAIILSEDWAFYQHEGFDEVQLKKVIDEAIKTKQFGRGASTITQQVIKNVFLSPEKTFSRKARELILAYKMERFLTKDKILEVYLNIIELGPNVYGIKQGSWHYFRKQPSQLNPKEAAFLAMLLPSPKRYSASFYRRVMSRFAESTVRNILWKMKIAKIISEDEKQFWMLEHLNWERVQAAPSSE